MVFMGTPAFAVPALRAVASVCDVSLVVTQPDRPRGRGRVMGESEISAEAARLALPAIKPADMRATDVRERLTAERADAFAVVAFGAILVADVLALPRAGCINLHGSLLPDYRGASPVQRALWDGRGETGVTTLFMDEGIDTGDVILSHRESVGPDDDAETLAARLADAGAPLLAESIVLAHAGRAPRTPQDRAAGSYAKKLKKRDGVVDWTLDARTVWNHARAVTPWPGATAEFRGSRVTIVKSRPETGTRTDGTPGSVLGVESDGVRVACGADTLVVTRIKPEGRAELAAAEWARGARLVPGEKFEPVKEIVS